MFDFNMDDDPTGPSDHIRSTLAFLDNNIRMLKKLSQKFQETVIKSISFVCQSIDCQSLFLYSAT